MMQVRRDGKSLRQEQMWFLAPAPAQFKIHGGFDLSIVQRKE